MKKFLTILSLVLALSLCFSALAEETAPAAPIDVETVTEQTATEQAIDAYRALKGAARVKNLDALKTELDAYVTDEKLTQEQADLILAYYTEQFASRGEKGGKKQDGTEKQTWRQKKQRNDGQQLPKTDEQQTDRQNSQMNDRQNNRQKQTLKQNPDIKTENGQQNGKGWTKTQNDGSDTATGVDTTSGATKKGK